jgi:hypothetical protein
MAFARATGSILLLSIWACTVEVQSIEAQEVPIPQLTPGSQRKAAKEVNDRDQVTQPPPPQTVALTVVKGSPLQIALDAEVQVKKVGQVVHGRVGGAGLCV